MTNGLLPLLALLIATPFHAVSKPTIQAWARFRKGSETFRAGLSARFFTADGRLRGVAGASTPTKTEELREAAAAKYEEAVELAAELSGTEVDGPVISEGQLKEMSEKLSEEDFAKVDAIISEAAELRMAHEAAAKRDGTLGDMRESANYYHEKATGRPLNWGRVETQTYERPKTLGQRFTDSESYQELVRSGVLKSNSGGFGQTRRMTNLGAYDEIAELQERARRGDEEAAKEYRAIRSGMKATTDLVHSGTGGPGEALVIEQILAGFLPLRQRPLAIRELFAQGDATSDTIRYMAQIGFESGAAAVAQASSSADDGSGAKPQSSISFEERNRPVETIATFMAATRQQLDDAGQLESIIDNQGRLMLMLEEENQLLSGNGASPNLQGVLGEAGVQTFDVTVGATFAESGLNNLMSIRTAKRMTTTGLGRIPPDAIVVHPNDSEEIDLLRDDNGAFRGGNPVGNFTFDQPLWGLRRVESEALTEGEALVGAFQAGAAVMERMPITVFTTDSHSDWFVRNIIAVLFEERLGFPIYFPSLFVKINFADWGESGS